VQSEGTKTISGGRGAARCGWHTVHLGGGSERQHESGAQSVAVAGGNAVATETGCEPRKPGREVTGEEDNGQPAALMFNKAC